MKILAFVDTHGSAAALKRIKELSEKEKPEIIVCAGDISIFGTNLDAHVQLLSSLKIPALFIHGNHESEDEMKASCSLFNNTHYIHKKLYEHGGFAFIGYGGGGFAQKDPRFNTFTDHIKDNLDKPIILVVHGPPFGTRVDFLSGSHHGNKSYRQFIDIYKPALVICGHFHENEGKMEKIGNSLIINPGPGRIIKIS
jgi:Icc-related predicted phosphoesterase